MKRNGRFVFRTYYLRETTYLGNMHRTWTSAPANAMEFRVDLSFRITEDAILYRPGVAETLKFAWIQYLSIFVILYYLGGWIMEFMFRKHIVASFMSMDMIPPGNNDPRTKYKQF